jgi:hypothetical protein
MSYEVTVVEIESDLQPRAVTPIIEVVSEHGIIVDKH